MAKGFGALIGNYVRACYAFLWSCIFRLCKDCIKEGEEKMIPNLQTPCFYKSPPPMLWLVKATVMQEDHAVRSSFFLGIYSSQK